MLSGCHTSLCSLMGLVNFCLKPMLFNGQGPIERKNCFTAIPSQLQMSSLYICMSVINQALEETILLHGTVVLRKHTVLLNAWEKTCPIPVMSANSLALRDQDKKKKQGR